MPKFLHSHVNLSSSIARVTDPETGVTLARVERSQGFWEARCAMTGKLLMPRVEHTVEHDHVRPVAWGTPKKKTIVSIGTVLRDLRAVLCPAPATSPSQGA